jgi:hypothetical protein
LVLSEILAGTGDCARFFLGLVICCERTVVEAAKQTFEDSIRPSRGGVAMRKVLFISLLTLAFFAIDAGSAQQTTESGEAVWSVDFVKVKPGMFEAAMNYFNSGWIPAREEAKRQGAIVTYRRIAEQPQSSSDWEIILMTEYKNQAAYDDRERVFAPIIADILGKNRGKMNGVNKKDLYEIVETRVLQDFSEVSNAHLKLIGRN